MIKNPQANAIGEHIHQVHWTMMRTADIDTFINAAWVICSTYHIVLTASPGAAIFGRNMLFAIPFIADWKQIGEYRQHRSW